MTELYTAEATSSRDVVRIDGRDDMGYRVNAPSDSDGAKDRLNPERLYAAALATCLHQALTVTATSSDVETAESAVTARVTLSHDSDQRYTLSAEVDIHLPGAGTRELYESVTAEALRTCPMVGEISVVHHSGGTP
jgi:lipoyl-dependent peroxiredoxin